MTDLEQTILNEQQFDADGNPIVVTQTEEDKGETVLI